MDVFNLDSGIDGLSASYETDNGSWSVSGTTFSGSATGNNSDDCGAAGSMTNTLTLKNVSGSKGLLSFDYAEPSLASGGYVLVDGEEVTSSGSFSKELEDEETAVVVIFSGDSGALTSSIDLLNVSFVQEIEVDITFLPSREGGTYFVNGNEITEETVISQSSLQGLCLDAVPDEGYKLQGWYSQTLGRFLYSSASVNAYFDVSQTVYPVFAVDTRPVWMVGDQRFTDLNEAIACSEDTGESTIVMHSSGTLETGTYTVPAGKTLLVPCDLVNTVSIPQPDIYDATAAFNPVAFRTLTMSEGTNLIVNGNLNINGKLNSNNNGYSGVTSGNYGYVIMDIGSSITVGDGGNLYCWGYISGAGSIYASAGSGIYEPFEICDLRGGTVTQTMNTNPQRVLPFQQYYAQNIEVPLTLEYGAIENLVGSVSVNGSISRPVLSFVGHEGKCLFKLSPEASFTKRYDPISDRTYYTVAGDAAVSKVMIDVSVRYYSEDFVLPLMQNTSIEIISGTTTLKQDLYMLPGCEITVDRGAQLSIYQDNKLFILDRDEYIGNGFVYGGPDMVPSFYQPDREDVNIFTPDKMTDAKLDINGQVTVDGEMLTSVSGGCITSSGAEGKIIFNSAPVSGTQMYQVVQTGTSISYSAVPVCAPLLCNGAMGTTPEYEYTETEGSEAGTKFSYCADEDIWHEGEPCSSPITVDAWPKNKFTENENYYIDGRKITVIYDKPCKIGYLSGDKYVAVAASDNHDGSYSFDIDVDCSEVVLVIKGDANGDGYIMGADAVMTRAAALRKITIGKVQSFAADVTGDGILAGPDAVLIHRVALRKSVISW